MGVCITLLYLYAEKLVSFSGVASKSSKLVQSFFQPQIGCNDAEIFNLEIRLIDI